MRYKVLLVLWALTAGFCMSAQEYLPCWQQGYMDIHTIATGMGDAALIIMPDGTTMMIDAGDSGKAKDKHFPDSSKRAGEWQAIYMNHFLKGTPSEGKVDYALLTHFHSDHMGAPRLMIEGDHGYGRSGITLVGDLIRFDKLIDRDWPDYDFPSAENIASSNPGFMDEYHKFVKYQMSQGMKMERFVEGSNEQFPLLHQPRKYRRKFEIRNMAANAQVWTGKGSSVQKTYKGDPKVLDENVFSCAIRITYGNFSYFNGGDIPGGNKNRYIKKERDVETPVAKVCGEVDVLKANHHGYYDCCNGFFMNTLSPEVVIFDARSDVHPVVPVMERMTDPLFWPDQGEYYITVNMSQKKLGEELWSYFKPWGHIVVRVYEGGEYYQIFVLDAESEDYPVIYKSDMKKSKGSGINWK